VCLRKKKNRKAFISKEMGPSGFFVLNSHPGSQENGSSPMQKKANLPYRLL
jgi:hypothetical protein